MKKLIIALVIIIIGALEARASNLIDSGGDPTGVADSSVALNQCLSTAGVNGVCTASGGKFRILGDAVIPANVTLKCGFSYPDRADYNSGYTTEHALLLDGGHSISASGGGATIRDCLIIRDGMTFPPLDDSSFIGTALKDNGNASFTLTDSEIFGFNTAVLFTGVRPYIDRALLDCRGVGTACLEVDTGNSDSGYIRDVRINPPNGAGTCASLTRQGVGLRMGGNGGPGAYLDGLVVQGFRTAQFDFEGGGVTELGQIWADAPFSTCGAINSTGVIIGPNASVHAFQVYISSQGTGMSVQSNGAESSIHFLSFNNVSQNALVLGNSDYSGNMNAEFVTYQTVGNAGIYIAHTNAGYHSVRTVMANINGRSAPYVQAAPGVLTAIGLGPFGQFSIMSFQTDLYGTNPFQSGAFVTVAGSDQTLSGINFQ